MPFGDKKSLFYKNVVNGGCKTNKSRFFNRFKSSFDTASLKISTRAFRIRIQISKSSIGRRVMVILLRKKNFGPNVRYCVLGYYFAVSNKYIKKNKTKEIKFGLRLNFGK